MIKIFISVRNRLAITKKCIQALRKHSKLPHQIYVYDNQTNYLVDEHFEYFRNMYKKGVISQVTFTTDESTFNAFSKASTCNMFGQQHEQDPKKDSYYFLVFMDNDIIVTPDWDKKLYQAWTFVNKKKKDYIKVIGQLPGGIKNRKEVIEMKGMRGKVGRLGGSGLWSVRPNFFRDVGFLDLRQLVGSDKRHDQLYWAKLQKASKGEAYILGLREKLGIHCGRRAGSVCNRLTRNKGNPKKKDMIKFPDQEEKLDGIPFDEFYESIINDKFLVSDW